MFWDYAGTDDKEEQDKDDKDNEDENQEMIKEEKTISRIGQHMLAEKMTGKDNDRRMFRKELTETQKKVDRKPWNYGSKGRWTL